MKLKIIITGTSGMVGEGVLNECLNHDDIEEILIINRKPLGISNPKIKEIIHDNFYDLSPIEDKLKGYNTCFFCLGVSSVNKKEEEYYQLTHTLTMEMAGRLSKLNRDMTFCYISGAGTDSTEKGKSMWARVKGKTENDLLKLSFKSVYNFRPAYLHPTEGMKNTHSYYTYLDFFYPLLKRLFPKYIISLKELAMAMINVSLEGYSKTIIEVPDIIILSKK